MKYTYLLLLALFSLAIACADNTDDKKTTKKRDQPNFAEVDPVVKEEKKAANPERKASSPEELAKAREIIAAASPAEVSAVNGKQTFKSYCAICHGITGDLNVNGATDLTASTLPLEERVAQVYHGRGLMTPFKGLLKDHEIVAVTKYIEELR